MDSFKVIYKLKKWTYTSTVYATDLEDARKRARLLARPGYTVYSVSETVTEQRTATKC